MTSKMRTVNVISLKSMAAWISVSILITIAASGQKAGQAPANPSRFLPVGDHALVLIGQRSANPAVDQTISQRRLPAKSHNGPEDSSPLFLPPAIYRMDHAGLAIAVGDLNGDTIPDMAALDDGELNILLGYGDGSFSPGFQSGQLGFPTSLALADLNGDGKADLAITAIYVNGLQGTVLVLLGNGDGTFQAPVVYDTGGLEARDVAVADVNGDGHPDLAVVTCGSSDNPTPCFTNASVGVLLGRGDGTFLPAAVYDGGGVDGASVALSDLNGDGKTDLVVINGCSDSICASGGTIAVRIGNGNGTFQPATIYDMGGSSWSVVVEDLNADGKLDLAVANLEGTASVLLGLGTGGFQAPVTYPGGAYAISLAVADVNGDGHPDLLLTDYDTGLDVLLGSGNGTFTSAMKYPSGGVAAQGVAAADLNGDGRLDVVEANLYCIPDKGTRCGLGTIGVLLNDDGPHSATTTAVASSADPVAVNQSLTYTATVTSLGAGLPAGTVTFTDAGKPISTVRLAGGQATYSTQYARITTHHITALYSGGTAHTASASPVLYEYVKKLPVASTTVVHTSGSPSKVGQPVTVTALVSSKFGPIPNGDLVTFMDGTTALGSVPLSGGTASLTTSSLSAKKHNVKAIYPGDATFKPSQGSVIQLVEP